MTPSSGNSNNLEKIKTPPYDLDLEFPVDPTFESKTIPTSVDALFRFVESEIKHKGLPPNFMEDRLRDKCYEEFKL
jgi:hypothetical protein